MNNVVNFLVIKLKLHSQNTLKGGNEGGIQRSCSQTLYKESSRKLIKNTDCEAHL